MVLPQFGGPTRATVCRGFDDVILRDRKILAQYGQRTGRARALKVGEAALEEIVIGEDRECGRSAPL